MSGARLVAIGDAPALAAIYDPVVIGTVISFETEPPGAGGMARRISDLSPTHPWLVIEEQGTVAGYAYAAPHRARPAYRWSVETTVYVHPEHRGRGLGRRLYGGLIDLATAWGYVSAFAGIALPNPSSEALHAASGFERVGVFPNAGYKLGAWHDVAWWWRSLSDGTAPVTPVQPSDEVIAGILGEV